MIDLNAIREAFPVTESWVYMDHAAVAPISRSVQRAMQEQLRDVASNGIVNSDRWNTIYARTRKAAARLIGARASEIAFVKNTTEGILTVANGLRWRPGDNVVISDHGFPANVYPWWNLKSKRVETRMVSEVDGRIPIEMLFDTVDERTRIVSISSVEFASGYRHNLHAIGEFCQANGILFFVDAIQSLGALRLDVKECKIDFLSADAHKWLLGPEGAGIFYCSKKAMKRIQLTQLGWASVINPGDYLDYDPTPLPDAQRFESGTLNTVGIYGLKACLDLIHKVGIDVIESRVLMLTDRLADGLKEKGYVVVSSRREGEKSGIVSFGRSDMDADMIFQILQERNIVSAARAGYCRLSPHFYNTEAEVNVVLEALP